MTKQRLEATIDNMVSADYKQRFKAEYDQLVIRMTGLRTMMEGYKNGTLPFKPMCDYAILQEQATAMFVYATALEERARIEGISLT